MTDLLGYTPIAAAAFGIPQFVPQIRRLRTTDDNAGLSWSWAVLTMLNNAAWFGYFFLAGYWTALVASSAVTLLAGRLTLMLTCPGAVRPRQLVLIGCWAATLGAGYGVAERDGLGTLLAAAFAVQVAPSLWTAYRTAHPTGISAGTWALILGELSCFLVFGLHQSDPRLTALGVTGVTASMLMLGRIWRTRRSLDRVPPGRPAQSTVVTRSRGRAQAAGNRDAASPSGRRVPAHREQCRPRAGFDRSQLSRHIRPEPRALGVPAGKHHPGYQQRACWPGDEDEH